MRHEMPLSAAIALLKKEIADKQAALAVMEAMASDGPAERMAAEHVAPANGTTAGRPRRPTLSIAKAAIEILKSAGRPMHGLREIVPALEAQGYKINHRAGFATVILRTKQARRTAPGTFAYAGGDRAAE